MKKETGKPEERQKKRMKPEIKAMADKYGVTVPQLCIRYTIQLGTASLPKTANPEHMKTNADVDFDQNNKKSA